MLIHYEILKDFPFFAGNNIKCIPTGSILVLDNIKNVYTLENTYFLMTEMSGIQQPIFECSREIIENNPEWFAKKREFPIEEGEECFVINLYAGDVNKMKYEGQNHLIDNGILFPVKLFSLEKVQEIMTKVLNLLKEEFKTKLDN